MIYMICGVPGSGKTWVCKQLEDSYEYIAHDDYIDDKELYFRMLESADADDVPVITECPFKERPMRERLESMRCKVKPVFIVEDPEVIEARYRRRESGKALPKSSVIRASTIRNRAEEWKAPFGTSEWVLNYLMDERKKHE